jgi:hypothetical protein
MEIFTSNNQRKDASSTQSFQSTCQSSSLISIALRRFAIDCQYCSHKQNLHEWLPPRMSHSLHMLLPHLGLRSIALATTAKTARGTQKPLTLTVLLHPRRTQHHDLVCVGLVVRTHIFTTKTDGSTSGARTTIPRRRHASHELDCFR